jgi:hypothetical protein
LEREWNADTAEQDSFHGIPIRNIAARIAAVTGIGNRNASVHGDGIIR